MKSYKIKGFVVKKNFFSEKEILNFEKNIVFFISKYCEKKSFFISNKAKKILKYNQSKLKISAIKLMEDIEKKNKKLFYEISTECSKIYSINNIDQNLKMKIFLKKFFGKNYLLIQRINPIMLFNKKNLSRLKYSWHQESKFYPQYDIGLHLWFPIFRNVKSDNDGGMIFALDGYKKNYNFKEIKNKNSWTQRIPDVDIEKKFQLISPKVNRRDAIFFIGPQLHKSDNQKNLLPRVSFVIRYLSNSKN
jgi:hypothetical protein